MLNAIPTAQLGLSTTRENPLPGMHDAFLLCLSAPDQESIEVRESAHQPAQGWQDVAGHRHRANKPEVQIEEGLQGQVGEELD